MIAHTKRKTKKQEGVAGEEEPGDTIIRNVGIGVGVPEDSVGVGVAPVPEDTAEREEEDSNEDVINSNTGRHEI